MCGRSEQSLPEKQKFKISQGDQCKIFLFSAQSFEALSERAVAVVVDPIQSVKGKVSHFLYSHWPFTSMTM